MIVAFWLLKVHNYPICLPHLFTMKVISWNVRGLEAPDIKRIVKCFLDSHKDLDFLLLEELKYVNFTLETNLNVIWKDSIKFCSSHLKGRGGVSLLVSPRWANFITANGCSPCNRAIQASVNINNTLLGICNIYGSNNYNERIALWDWIASLPDIPWIIGGDFNMVEHGEDKMGGTTFNKDLTSHNDRWNFNINSQQKLLQMIGRKRAKDYRFEESILNNNLSQVENDAQSNPSNPKLTASVASARDALRRHQLTKIKGAMIRAHTHWLQFGDKGSKFFFNLLRQKHRRETIDRIIIDNDEISDLDKIKEAFALFYQKLFTSEEFEADKTLRIKFQSITPRRISEEDAAS